MDKQYGSITSSIDPTQISLSVLAFVRVISGLALGVGVITAADQTTLLAQIPTLVTDVVALVPIGYAAWHAGDIIFGILRKGLVAFFKKK